MSQHTCYLWRTVRRIAVIAWSTVLVNYGLLTQGKGMIGVDLTPYEEKIEAHRKVAVSVTFLDEKGDAVVGAKVIAQQVTHDFFFGNAPEYLIFAYAPRFYTRGGRFGWRPLPAEQLEQYKALYLELFNYATIPAFYWADYEPRPNYLPLRDAVKQIAEWLKANGVTVKGHPLIFGWDPVGRPGWVYAKALARDWDGIRKSLFQRIEREVSEFKGLIDSWDVVNEPINQPWFDNLGPNYIAEAFRLAKEIDPDAILVLNEFGMLVNDEIRRQFIERAKSLIEAGVPIDVIGVQSHIFTGKDIKHQLASLETIYAALDELATLGKPLHITEFQIPLPAVIEAFGVSAKEAEELQAEIAVIFYTVFFSHPAVEAIVYWNFYRAWQPGSGFLRDDLSIKPIFYALKELIYGKWTTHLEAQTNEKGQVEFRGFPGAYRIFLKHPDGREEEFSIHVTKGSQNAFIIRSKQ